MLESPTRAIPVAAKLDEAWDGTVGPVEVVTLTYVRIISRPSGVTKLPFARVWRGLGDFLLPGTQALRSVCVPPPEMVTKLKMSSRRQFDLN